MNSLKKKNQKSHKKILYNFIDELDFSKYDSEYRELFLTSIKNIADIVNVNVNFKLNQKIYGTLFALLISFFKKN